MNTWDHDARAEEALELLDHHHDAFYSAAEIAIRTGHPVPSDTRGWSQILVSILSGIMGRQRQKGSDLVDGSDVKAANTWEAIDTPRFNGVLKAGTKAEAAGSLVSLESMPHLFFVLWDKQRTTGAARCRVWVVRPRVDPRFRGMADAWYQKLEAGEIKSNNFQLHPPRGLDSDVFRNTCGNLVYPKLFQADRHGSPGRYALVHYDPQVLVSGACQYATDEAEDIA